MFYDCLQTASGGRLSAAINYYEPFTIRWSRLVKHSVHRNCHRVTVWSGTLHLQRTKPNKTKFKKQNNETMHYFLIHVVHS